MIYAYKCVREPWSRVLENGIGNKDKVYTLLKELCVQGTTMK